jgi:hypothetical protein
MKSKATAKTDAIQNVDKLSTFTLTKQETKLADDIAKLSADKLHTNLLLHYKETAESYVLFQLHVLDARRRMFNGEKVGGCDTFTAYREKFLVKPGESPSTCQRRISRLLEGLNPATKYQNKKAGKKKMGKKKSARAILAEADADADRTLKIATDKAFAKGQSEANADAKDFAAKKAKEAAEKTKTIEKQAADIDELKKELKAAKAAPAKVQPAEVKPAEVQPMVARTAEAAQPGVTDKIDDAVNFVLDLAARSDNSKEFVGAVIAKLRKLSQ